MKIEAGQILYDQYAGQGIIIYGQPANDQITLLSSKTNGKVTGTSVQLLQNITDVGITIDGKMNANYFVISNGQALGVRCGIDEWSVPRQNAWLYYALMKNGKTEVGMDNNFWYTPKDVVFACSPAMVLMKDGSDVYYISPNAGNSKANANTQSMLIRTKERFAFAVCKGKLTPVQCRAWVKSIEGIQDLIFMDSGGSTCLEANGSMVVNTARKISNALAFYHKATGDDNMGKTMNGIDISNWQSDLDLSKIACDFVIVKATEGVGFVDKSCDKFFQQGLKLGKKLGFYHFARPELNDAVKEAEFFYQNTKNYFGKGIPVLDWESSGKSNVTWALTWLNKIYELTGVKPMIYMSESVVNAYDWSKVVAGDYGLWVAKYRDNKLDYNYDMSNAGTKPSVKWWSFYAMWQWTSCGRLNGYNASVDCDIFYGDAAVWDAYVGKVSVSLPDTQVDYETLYKEALAKNKELLAENTDLKLKIANAKKALE